jgi:uncharacterized protein YehS (DUF1456 family)
MTSIELRLRKNLDRRQKRMIPDNSDPRKDMNMTNNDILRRIRYIFDFNDEKMIAIFSLADCPVTREQISDWLKKEEDPAYQSCSDAVMARFLNGLIIEKRGKKEGEQPEPEKRLTNNIIFMKLKIALNMKTEDVFEVLELVDFKMSKHEFSAFFRKPGHKHYRECKDQVLRNFLKGLQLKYRSKYAVVDKSIATDEI